MRVQKYTDSDRELWNTFIRDSKNGIFMLMEENKNGKREDFRGKKEKTR